MPKKGSLQIDGDLTLEHRVVDIDHRQTHHDTGIVHQNIGAASHRLGFVEQARKGLGIGNVGGKRQSLAARSTNLLSQGLSASAIDITDDDNAAVAG